MTLIEFDIKSSLLLSTISYILLLISHDYLLICLIFLYVSLISMILHMLYYSIGLITPIKSFWRILLHIIYVIIAICLLLVLTDSKTVRISIAVIGIIINCLTYCIITLFPMPCPNSIDGKYKSIGTSTFEITPNETTKFTVQAWYPIDDVTLLSKQIFSLGNDKSVLWTSGNPTTQLYESEYLLNVMCKLNGIPKFVLNHLLLARSNSKYFKVFSPTVQLNKFPIAIYSHGLYGWRQLHSSLCERLASHGFIVFAIDYEPDAMVNRPINTKDFSSFNFHEPAFDGDSNDYRSFYTNGMNRRVNYLKCFIDYLEKSNGNSENQSSDNNQKFSISYDKIFLWGHSYGGGTSASFGCRYYDKRISGIALLDPWMFPMKDQDRLKGSLCPIISFSSHLWEFSKYQLPFTEDLLKNSKSNYPGYNFIIKESDHQNFCEVIYLASRFLLARPSGIGKKIDPYIILNSLELFITSFFLSINENEKILNSDESNTYDNYNFEESNNKFYNEAYRLINILKLSNSIIDKNTEKILLNIMTDRKSIVNSFDTKFFDISKNKPN